MAAFGFSTERNARARGFGEEGKVTGAIRKRRQIHYFQ